MQFQNTGKREHGKSYTDSQSFLPNVMYLTSASMARASHMALPNLKDGKMPLLNWEHRASTGLGRTRKCFEITLKWTSWMGCRTFQAEGTEWGNVLLQYCDNVHIILQKQSSHSPGQVFMTSHLARAFCLPLIYHYLSLSYIEFNPCFLPNIIHNSGTS